MMKIASRLWVLTYELEEMRQRYADQRKYLRQAGARVMLVLLRLVGGRYV